MISNYMLQKIECGLQMFAIQNLTSYQFFISMIEIILLKCNDTVLLQFCALFELVAKDDLVRMLRNHE